MLWQNESLENIIGGKTADGISYLKLFLTDYSKRFNIENLNSSCHNCVKEYHDKWINTIKEMENTCQYRLYKKYDGIPLSFGSSICVNNGNITDELAEQLIQSRGAHLFEKMPEAKTTPIVEPTTDATKFKAKRGNKKR